MSSARQERAESIAARDLRIVGMAQRRIRPAEIATKLRVTATTVYNAIRAAREAGVDIAHFPSGPVEGTSPTPFGRPMASAETLNRSELVAPWPELPRVAPSNTWAGSDDVRLHELVARGVRLTAIAASMRKPYRLVIEAGERLGLFEPRLRAQPGQDPALMLEDRRTTR